MTASLRKPTGVDESAGSAEPVGAVLEPTPPLTPACYDVQIRHQRRDPLDYGFSQRSSIWLVDVDRLPRLPRGLGALVHFSAGDHLGEPDRTIRENVDVLLADHELPPPARILMLANPRVLGYVFNPLTVFYCFDAGGQLDAVVAEVRNTYSGRHSYVLRPDAAGRAEADKVFYVSPFYPVDGRYQMIVPTPGEEVRVSVTLHRGGERPFVAVLAGRRRTERPASLFTALRTPLATRAVMAGIRRHGIALYLRGLRPVPRTPGRQPPHRVDRAEEATRR